MVDARKTPEERYEYGRSRREHSPLESHAEWSPDQRRPDPVSLIQEQDKDRIPWLVNERHVRMSNSSFTFFRGCAGIMAADLAGTPCSGVQAQLCGDAHLANFGAYASPERKLVFDLNDFDETLPGPWEWDVKRLASSLFIAGRHNGLEERQNRKIARRCVTAYRNAMARFAEMRLTEIWYDLYDAERLLEWLSGNEKVQAQKRIKKYKRKDSRHALDRLAEEVDGEYRIRSEPPLLIPLRDLPDQAIRDSMQGWVFEGFEEYRNSVADELHHLLNCYRIVDFAIKVVGVGSVGTRCAILLLEGRDKYDPLFLQIKQAERSVLEDHIEPSRYQNSAERVVQGQRLMQAASDIFLGWTQNSVSDHHYYWRQLKDWKGSIDVENLSLEQLKQMADMRGWNLARAHARSGDPIAITGYLGTDKQFDRAIADFSQRYSDQNQRDYDAFVETIAAAGGNE